MTLHNSLRDANTARQKIWDEWGISATVDWRVNELMGEVGEVCNVLKKLHRQRQGIAGSCADGEMLADELADVVICLDLLLMTLELDPSAPVLDLTNTAPLPAQGRRLFTSTALLDKTIENLPSHRVLTWKNANVVHSWCATIARREKIDLAMALAKKFNETSRKRSVEVYLAPPGLTGNQM